MSYHDRKAQKAGAISRVRRRTETRQGGGEADEPILVAKKNDCIESYLVSWKTWFSAIILGDQWSSALTNDS